MGWLNETLSRNARVALERAQADARKKGEKLPRAAVARRMAARMQREGEPWKADDVANILRRLLKAERRWNVDYLEAFCGAIGAIPERLVAVDFDNAKVKDATYAQYLTAALGRQLSPAETRKLVRSVARQIEVPGLFDLVDKIAELLRTAPDQDKAIGLVLSAIQKSRLWAEETLPEREVSDRGK